MGLGIFEDTFGVQRVKRTSVRNNDQTREYLVEVTAAVQTVVDTFRDPRTGDRYVVGLSDKVEAFANQGEKRIVVSHQPLLDKGLKVSTACTVMTGLVLHEVGHTLFTFPVLDAFKRAFGDRSKYKGWGTKPYDALAYTIWNIGDDARLEARMSENIPVARDIFPSTLHWVALRSGMVGTKQRWLGKGMKLSDRVNFAGCAIRYPWTQVWHKDSATIAERLWWQAWAAGFIALADDDEAGLVAAVKVAVDRLRDPDEVEEDETDEASDETGDEPEPVDPTDDFDTDDGDEDDDEDGDEPDDDESDDGDEPSDEEGEDEGEGGYGEDDEAEDDDETEPGEGKGDGGDEGDEESESGGTKVSIPDDIGDDLDEDDDEDVEDDGTETESQSGEGPLGETTDDEEPDPTEWEQDFNASDLKGRVDALNHGNDGDWEAQKQAQLVQKLLNEERTIDRVKSGEYGTARVEVRDPLEWLTNQHLARYR